VFHNFISHVKDGGAHSRRYKSVVEEEKKRSGLLQSLSAFAISWAELYMLSYKDDYLISYKDLYLITCNGRV
jgi:hypothetical protein